MRTRKNIFNRWYQYLVSHKEHGLWCCKEGLESQVKGGLVQAAAVLGGRSAGVHERMVHGRVGLGSVRAAPGTI